MSSAHPFFMPISITNLRFLKHGREGAETPFSRILIIWGGKGTLYVNDHEYEISRGSVFLCSSIPQLNLRLHSLTALQGLWIEYQGLALDGSNPTGLEHPVPLHRCPTSIIRLASELEKQWGEPQSSTSFRLQQLFTDLLAELSKEIADRHLPSSFWLQKILQIMETRYNEDLSRELMARLANISPEHFSRMFRKNMGRTFNAHLTLLRIRSAQRRILTGSPNLNKLAQEVGYKEGLYLSRKFKESVGLSPTAYQQKHKRIATLNLNHTASLIALDITPELGVYTTWLERNFKKITGKTVQKWNPYGHSPATYYSTIADVNPDIIISYNNSEENHRFLPLAPVIELPFMTMNWREQFRMIADIVNKRQKAEEWLAHYDKRVTIMNDQLDSKLGYRGTAIVWEIGASTAYCCSPSYGRGCQILYDDLGFRAPANMLDQNLLSRGYVEVELESISSYPADHIFITALPSHSEGRHRLQKLFRSANWLKLEAVRRNQVYVLNDPELFCGYDPLSSQEQLSTLMRVVSEHHKFA
ncbi:helix-turn-helix domain-containing protein [Paenibacillus sp. GCM10027627]|uniref:helix-turn-helix domain-containing protein n=1 Tax=unclassified Paenibacillus TaxID=185978 RepID=UPI003641FF8C